MESYFLNILYMTETGYKISNGTDLGSIFVDFTSDQTITGLKTFKNNLNANQIFNISGSNFYTGTTFSGNYYKIEASPIPALVFYYNTNVISYIDGFGNYNYVSDKKLKENIKPLAYGINEIMQLNPLSYNFINNSNKKSQIGFIAQEVNEVIPELININDGEHFINMTQLIPVIVNAMKEQQLQINNLIQRINKLENK
jgi:hypothetical protein